MITPDLVDYIKKQLAAGRNRQEISPPLLAQGWTPEDLDQAFVAAGASPVPAEARVMSAPPDSSVSRPGDEVLTPAEIDRLFWSPGSASKKKFWLAAAGALVLLLVAGGAAAWFFYFQSPERILSQALAKAGQVKSSAFSGRMNLEIEATGLTDLFSTLSRPSNPTPANLPLSAKATIGLAINFEGQSDISNKDHSKFAFSMDFVNKDQPAPSPSAFGLEMRGLDQVFYLRLKENPWLPLGDLKDQWIKVDLAEIQKQIEQAGVKTQTSQSWQLTEEETQKLLAEVQKLKLFKITQQLPGEKIDGQNTFHYAYAIAPEPLKKLILEMPDLLKLPAESRLTDQEKQELDKTLSGLSAITGEIWIGQKDLFVRRETAKFELKIDEKEAQGSVKIDLAVDNKNINQPVTVEAPTQSKSLQEALGPLLGGLLGGAANAPCDNLPAGAEKDKCYLDQATGTDSCEKITGLATKNDCYYKVAQKTTDEWVCTQIKGAGSQGWKDECLRSVAEIKKDRLLCRDVVMPDWKNYCLATAGRDASFCQKIKKASTKQTCLDRIKTLLSGETFPTI